MRVFRETRMYLYSENAPLYRFICLENAPIDWGIYEENAPFYKIICIFAVINI